MAFLKYKKNKNTQVLIARTKRDVFIGLHTRKRDESDAFNLSETKMQMSSLPHDVSKKNTSSSDKARAMTDPLAPILKGVCRKGLLSLSEPQAGLFCVVQISKLATQDSISTVTVNSLPNT